MAAKISISRTQVYTNSRYTTQSMANAISCLPLVELYKGIRKRGHAKKFILERFNYKAAFTLVSSKIIKLSFPMQFFLLKCILGLSPINYNPVSV